MNKHYILGVQMSEKIDDSFSIGMCWEGDIFNLHFNFVSLFIDIEGLDAF